MHPTGNHWLTFWLTNEAFGRFGRTIFATGCDRWAP
jgi:hypothetical protein